MTIQKLDDFAENGDKNLTGIDVQQGFIQAEKPARQWFNYLFNSITKKVNEVITAVETLVVSTDKIADGAVTAAKLAPDFKITGGMIAKDTELNTPKLSATYALTTLDAPNINMASDGTLKRSNDPLNASTRKVGTLGSNLVERGTDGYPTNNNAIGVGQTWQDVMVSRDWQVTYTNSTGRPISVYLAAWDDTAGAGIQITINGETWSTGPDIASVGHYPVTLIIPNGSTYKISNGYTGKTRMIFWRELR